MASLAKRLLDSEAFELAREFLCPSSGRRRAIPPLDGGLAPNDRLDGCAVVAEIEAADDVLVLADGSVVVSSDRSIVRLSGSGFAERTIVATLPGSVTALGAFEGSIVAGVAGVGVMSVAADGSHQIIVEQAGGAPLRCPTAIAIARDGTVLVADGSRAHPPADWVWDLMEERSEGRLVALAPGSRAAEVVADNLAWPSGVAIDPSDGSILVAQAWSHCVARVDRATRVLRPLAVNLPGYPARMSFAADGTVWLAMFALRTHLVEFVLRQRDFKQEMMRTIHPDYWIRPDLRSIDSGLVPLQGGGIRKLGVTKPWAPPRSYGMVCRLDADGTPLESLQSRPGGRNHGITSVRAAGGELWMTSKGAGRLLRHAEVSA